jgi:hypothetical protein
MNIRPVGAELAHADGRTCRFYKFVNAPYNTLIKHERYDIHNQNLTKQGLK